MSLLLSFSRPTLVLVIPFCHVRLFSEFPISNGISPGRELMTRYFLDLADCSPERVIIFLMATRTGRDWSRMGCRRLWFWTVCSVWNYEVVGDGDDLLCHGRLPVK